MPSTLQDENPDPLHNIAGVLSGFSKALVTGDSKIYLPIQALFKPGQRQTAGNSRRTAGRLPFFPRNVGALNTGTVWFSRIRSGALDSVVRNQGAQISKRKEVKEHETYKPAIA